MILNVRRCDAKRRLLDGGWWHKWFAWHPVKIKHRWVWLQLVQRQSIWWFCFGSCGFDTNYRFLHNTTGQRSAAQGYDHAKA